jgi:murein DD-endopeptidase MepM/ murein hydrolase activator NlpD
MKPKIDGLAIVGLVLIFFLGASLLTDAVTASPMQTPNLSEASVAAGAPPTTDPTSFAAPYASYVITQGPHGASYGQMAVDLASGEGATILSPISGVVSELYTDEYGNPTLVIENDIYRVTLLHGQYNVTLGQSVALGEAIGSESNQGYTTDLVGNPCWGRAGCGFHTHLNVFDKRLGINVNPLDLLP